MTRIAFLGTPEAAVPLLRRLAEEHNVPAVITRPDKPRGRSGQPQPTPVKVTAEALAIPVMQPDTADAVVSALKVVAPLDLAVLVAYGVLVPPAALEIPEKGILNLHFSLLPRWRGAAPVARAIMAGDEMTGVTIIRIDEGLDSGDVLTAQAVDIGPDETAGGLTTRLATMGADLMMAAIEAYISGDLEPVPQSNEGMEYANKITPDDRRLSIGSNAEDFVNQVRALSPEPGATLEIDGRPHKILQVYPSQSIPKKGTWAAVADVPVIGLTDGGVELRELQPPGKNRMYGGAWLRGRMKKFGNVS